MQNEARSSALPVSSAVIGGLLLSLAGGCSGGGGGGGGGGGSGAVLFAKTYGSPDGQETIERAVATPDGGYAFVGSHGYRGWGNGTDDNKLWVTKLDALGDIEWSRSLAKHTPSVSSGGSKPQLVEPRVGGGFYVVSLSPTGHGGLFYSGNFANEIGVQCFDAAGNTLWTRLHDIGAQAEWTALGLSLGLSAEIASIQARPSGGLVILGDAKTEQQISLGGGVFETIRVNVCWAMGIDGNGDLLWLEVFENDNWWLYPGDIRVAKNGFVYVSLNGHRVTGFTFIPSRQSRVYELDALGNRTLTEWNETSSWSHALEPVPATGAEDHFIWGGGEDSTGAEGQSWEVNLLSDSLTTLFSHTLSTGGNIVDVAGSLEGLPGEPAFLIARVKGPCTTELIWLADSGVELHAETLGLVVKELRVSSTSAGVRRFEVLATDPPAIGSDLGTLRLLTSDIGPGAPSIDTNTVLATQVPTMCVNPPQLSESRKRTAGFVPGSNDLWTWEPVQNPYGRKLAFRDPSGNLNWSHSFVDSEARGVERGLDLEIIVDPSNPADWEIAVLGVTDSGTSAVVGGVQMTRSPAWLIRLDKQGATQQQLLLENAQVLGGGRATNSRHSQANYTLETSSDGALLVGLLADAERRVAKIDDTGAVPWCSRPLAEEGTDTFQTRIVALENGDVLFCHGKSMARLAGDGQVLWRRKLQYWTMTSGLAVSSDGTTVLLHSSSDSLQFSSFDASGQPRWETLWNNLGNDIEGSPVALVATADGGFAALSKVDVNIAPNSPLPALQVSSMFLVTKVAADGTPLWAAYFGGLGYELPNSIEPMTDGGLLVCGTTSSVTSSQDGWLLRLDSCGRISSSCAAEYIHRDSGFDYTLNPLADPFVGATSVPAVADVPGQLVVSSTTADEAQVTDLLVTRQCSGISKDPPAAPPGQYSTLRVRVGQGSGIVTLPSSPLAPACASDCTYQFPTGTTVDLAALPDPGFDLPNWGGASCASQSLNCSVSLDKDRTVVVDFPTLGGGGNNGSLDLTVITVGNGSAYVEAVHTVCDTTCTFPGIASPGDTVEIYAIADPGSTFAGFSGCDSEVGETCYVDFNSSNRTVTVTFN